MMIESPKSIRRGRKYSDLADLGAERFFIFRKPLPDKEISTLDPLQRLAHEAFLAKIPCFYPLQDGIFPPATFPRRFVMVLAEFSIFPLDKGESVSPYVARCLDLIDRSGITYRSHAMGTTLEGGYEEVMAVVKQCFDALATDCNRIECSLKIDYRRGQTNRLDGKIASVEQKLGRKLRT
jgi:uncharacterized protein (TIGR00106 family)